MKMVHYSVYSHVTKIVYLLDFHLDFVMVELVDSGKNVVSSLNLETIKVSQ
jgi:hypothetical protein